MARLIDFEKDENVEAEPSGDLPGNCEHVDRPNPNLGRFSAAISCYPIVSQLAGYLDLNSLYELSRTCRQVRANLLQYRKLLIGRTLRCENECENPAARLGDALHASQKAWTSYGKYGEKTGRITSGKVGACARDLVGECRKCSRIICRNCVLKSPPTSSLKDRHRRLCRTCMKAPLDLLTCATMYTISSAPEHEPVQGKRVARLPCTCQDGGVWMCQACGHSSRMADTTYLRGWVWRTRYSACGGLGAGLGEGNEGVECGRGSDCLAAREVEQEIECDADDIATIEAEMAQAKYEGHRWQGSSYSVQEVVGIGGVVKKKIKKRISVGAVVKEYEDERVRGIFLAREQNGNNRSFCAWCERIVLGKKDLDRKGRSTDSIASSSSSASA